MALLNDRFCSLSQVDDCVVSFIALTSLLNTAGNQQTSYNAAIWIKYSLEVNAVLPSLTEYSVINYGHRVGVSDVL